MASPEPTPGYLGSFGPVAWSHQLFLASKLLLASAVVRAEVVLLVNLVVPIATLVLFARFIAVPLLSKVDPATVKVSSAVEFIP